MQAHNNNVEELLGAYQTIFVVSVYQRNSGQFNKE